MNFIIPSSSAKIYSLLSYKVSDIIQNLMEDSSNRLYSM